MAPKASLSMLFHPKKGANKETPSSSPRKSSSITPRPKPEPEIEDELKLPDGPYQEFRLMSSALNGWKYDVMKFDSRKPVDISTWPTPIKLNRKELKREDNTVSSAPEAVGPMLGPDGKPVIGADGKMVMVDAEGRPIHSTDGYSGGAGRDAKGKGGAMNAKKKFQKKTRQVYYVPDEVRQLRREERYPWVIEDSTGNEIWVGKMEEVSQSETRAFFMPAANDIFKFVPAHRWYKFQKKPHYSVWSAEEAEAIYQKHQKNMDPQVWLSRNRKGQAPSAATSAIFKAESEGRALSGSSSLVHNAGQSLGPGGRRLKTVENGMDGLFGDDDEDGNAKRRREKEFGGEGDLDEVTFEEDFADDEEQMDVDENDEEAKEQQERIKREQKSANKTREGYVDASDDDEEATLTKDGKKFKQMLRNRDGNDAYDSDEEKNPYASSEEEEEEEELPVTATEPAIQQQPQQVDPHSGSQTPKPAAARPKNGQSSTAGSRATSPAPTPGLGGHSIVAKRATSPKAPKAKTNTASRGNSPLASRATSPATGSRATSPVTGAGNGGSRAGSPVGQSPIGGAQKSSNKRKATDDVAAGSPPPTTPNGAGTGAPPKAKKRKAHGPNAVTSAVPAGELEDRMVIEWLRNTPNASTRDCIQHFTPYLTDEAKKTKFTTLVKEVAQLKAGVLVLRNAYRAGSAAPSPAATPVV